ncbi:MAG: S-layer homology domain-containing protein [Oscillospiraceae bacterium]|nr:S-layer homology domain-containing protein [Oscillospiraceae bacterium]
MSKNKKWVAAAVALFLLAPMIAFALTTEALEIESITVTAPIVETNPANYAPIAENLNYTTYKGVAVYGKFAAVDPEGDLLTFRIVSQPKKGNVTVSDSKFIYTPSSSKKGKDMFTYVALDPNGNVSQEATVNLVIEKQSTKITYADMAGNEAEYSALRLAEDGVFIGEQVGSNYYFNPNETLSRGEFLAMCSAVTDIAPLTDIERTGFSDDALMPAWVKPYVGAALMDGIISGYRTESGSAIFAPNLPITYAEAVVMLNNALDISDVKSVSYFDSEGIVPAWASQAAANLSACNILNDVTLSTNAPLTRAQAASILAPAAELLKARKNGKSFLSWAF